MIGLKEIHTNGYMYFFQVRASPDFPIPTVPCNLTFPMSNINGHQFLDA